MDEGNRVGKWGRSVGKRGRMDRVWNGGLELRVRGGVVSLRNVTPVRLVVPRIHVEVGESRVGIIYETWAICMLGSSLHN